MEKLGKVCKYRSKTRLILICHNKYCMYYRKKNTKNVNFAYGWSTRETFYMKKIELYLPFWLPSVFSHAYILFILLYFFFLSLAITVRFLAKYWFFFLSNKMLFHPFQLYGKQKKNVQVLKLFSKMSRYHASWSTVTSSCNILEIWYIFRYIT